MLRTKFFLIFHDLDAIFAKAAARDSFYVSLVSYYNFEDKLMVRLVHGFLSEIKKNKPLNEILFDKLNTKMQFPVLPSIN